jgi:hypothetical protein
MRVQLLEQNKPFQTCGRFVPVKPQIYLQSLNEFLMDDVLTGDIQVTKYFVPLPDSGMENVLLCDHSLSNPRQLPSGLWRFVMLIPI